MTTLPNAAIHVVDVFADQPLAGNPLAVMVADVLPDAPLRQAIARETNLSETTFLTLFPAADGSWPVRIHTPTEELPFAGHPVLGTAWVIRERLSGSSPDRLVLQTGKGDVPVRFEGSGPSARVWLEAPAATLKPGVPDALLASVADAFASGPLPRWSGNNGPKFLLLSTDDPAALEQPIRDSGALASVLAATASTGVLLAAPVPGMTLGQGFAVRVFFLADGLREDPATGSAAAVFGECLRRAGHVGDCLLEQGTAMGRPSRIHLGIPLDGPIEVGGAVQPVWRGSFG